MIQKITIYGGEGEELLKRVRRTNPKKMSEKEVIAASNSVFIEAKKFKNGITLQEIREATDLPKELIGI